MPAETIYPAELRNVLNVGEPTGELQNLGAPAVKVKVTNPGGVVTSITYTDTKEFDVDKQVANCRMALEVAGFVITPGVLPIVWIGTRLKFPDYTEIVQVKKV